MILIDLSDVGSGSWATAFANKIKEKNISSQDDLPSRWLFEHLNKLNFVGDIPEYSSILHLFKPCVFLEDDFPDVIFQSSFLVISGLTAFR